MSVAPKENGLKIVFPSADIRFAKTMFVPFGFTLTTAPAMTSLPSDGVGIFASLICFGSVVHVRRSASFTSPCKTEPPMFTSIE